MPFSAEHVPPGVCVLEILAHSSAKISRAEYSPQLPEVLGKSDSISVHPESQAGPHASPPTRARAHTSVIWLSPGTHSPMSHDRGWCPQGLAQNMPPKLRAQGCRIGAWFCFSKSWGGEGNLDIIKKPHPLFSQHFT